MECEERGVMFDAVAKEMADAPEDGSSCTETEDEDTAGLSGVAHHATSGKTHGKRQGGGGGSGGNAV